MDRHPATATWRIPAAHSDGRLNLRDLMSRPARFEHHLVVVGRAGGAQLECATASEPLAFAHANLSDEYALMLPTGDPMLDLFQARTFISDRATGADVGRVRHGVGDLLLHPHGFLHWPGRLRPPYEVFRFGAGMRRRGLSLVACASAPCLPGERPLGGRETDLKRGRPDVPLALFDLLRDSPGVVGIVARASLTLVLPGELAPPRGGYAVGLTSCDLVHIPPGGSVILDERALLLSSDTDDAEPPPPIWTAEPAPPFPPAAQPGTGALTEGELVITPVSDETVHIHIQSGADIPRHWLARMLYRVALHGPLGTVETYGGAFHDGTHFGLRDGGRVPMDRALLERVYRAVVPPGYDDERPL
jgi:hypothetical protein